MQKDIQYKSDRFQRERPSTLKHEMTNYLNTANNRHLDSALRMAKTCKGDLMATVHMVFLVMTNAIYVQKLAGKTENSYQKLVHLKLSDLLFSLIYGIFTC